MATIKFKQSKNNPAFNINIDKKSKIVFVTGAGVSVGSGLQTYYGKDGAYTNLSKKPEDIINPRVMRHSPNVIWNEMAELIKRGFSAPASITHKRIAEIESLAEESMIVTQNVDELHEKGGAKNVLHIHGNAAHCYCMKCEDNNNHDRYYTVDLFNGKKSDRAPECPKCGEHNIVPDIVPFEGSFNPITYNKMIGYFYAPIDVCFVSGTQMQFPHIESLIFSVRSRNPDAIIIDINPDVDYHNDYADYNVKESSDSFFDNLEIIK